MFTVIVQYPHKAGSRFDMDYYLNTHMALARRLWGPMGLRGMQVLHATGTADRSPPPYQVVTLLTFASADAFKAAGKAHGGEIMADIANFTDVRAEMVMAEAVLSEGV